VSFTLRQIETPAYAQLINQSTYERICSPTKSRANCTAGVHLQPTRPRPNDHRPLQNRHQSLTLIGCPICSRYPSRYSCCSLIVFFVRMRMMISVGRKLQLPGPDSRGMFASLFRNDRIATWRSNACVENNGHMDTRGRTAAVE
jgi:hypothetical protein